MGRGSEGKEDEHEHEQQSAAAANAGGGADSSSSGGGGSSSGGGSNNFENDNASAVPPASANARGISATEAGTGDGSYAGTVGTAALLDDKDDGGHHAGLVLAYLRQRGLDAAASDVERWVRQRAEQEGGSGGASGGAIGSNAGGGNHLEEEEEGDRKMPAKKAGEIENDNKSDNNNDNNNDNNDGKNDGSNNDDEEKMPARNRTEASCDDDGDDGGHDNAEAEEEEGVTDGNNATARARAGTARSGEDESVMGWMSAMSSTVGPSLAGRTMASDDPSRSGSFSLGASVSVSASATASVTADRAPTATGAAAAAAEAAANGGASATQLSNGGGGARSASSSSSSSSSVKKFFTDVGRSIRLSMRDDGGREGGGTIGESQCSSSGSGSDQGGKASPDTGGMISEEQRAHRPDPLPGTGTTAAHVQAQAQAGTQSAALPRPGRPTPSAVSGFQSNASRSATASSRRSAASSLPPGAYAVNIPAVPGGWRPGPQRRRRFSGGRYSREDDDEDEDEDDEDEDEDGVDVGTVDTLDRFQRVIDGDNAGDDDDGTLGRLDRYVDQVLERDAQAERAELRRLSSGRVVTVAEATAVEDQVFEASVVDDKDGMGGAAAKWSRGQKALVAGGFLLLVAVIVALSVAVPNNNNGSAITDSVGLGEVCINDDPTICACYDQSDYRGTINTTVSGLTCQAWGVQDPHDNVYVQNERWPMLEANYCRNPSGSPGVWCYTTDPDVRWEYCNVPQCETSTVPITASPVAAPVDPPLLDIETYCEEEDVQPQEATSSIYLDGGTTHIALTNTSQADSGINFDGGPLTIEAWIKPELKVNFATILSNREGGGGMSGFLFSVNTWEEQNGKLYFEGTYGQVATTKSVQWGKWQHVAVTYDGTNPAFYIDGKQIPFFKQNYYGPFNIDAGYLDAKIGEMGLYSWSNSFFKGSIDELKVWDYARTGEEIRSSMHCQGDETAAGLVSYYRFDEGDDGMVVYDSGPRGNHGVIVVGESNNEESEDGGNGSESSVGYMYTEGISLCTLCSSTDREGQ